MMRDMVIGSVVAAIAMFLWGFLFWGVGLIDPFAHTNADAQQAVAKALQDKLPTDGVYFVPDRTLESPDAWAQSHTKGPIATVSIMKSGADPMAASKLIAGFVHMLVATIILGTIMMVSNRPSYLERLQLGALVGIGGTVFANLTQPIWFDSPWGYHLTNGFYQLVAWLIAAAILAYFVRRKTAFI